MYWIPYRMAAPTARAMRSLIVSLMAMITLRPFCGPSCPFSDQPDRFDVR